MKCILGTKLGMTQVFREDGTVVPVTKVQAGPCVVTQVKTKDKDGVNAVQIGFGEQKKFRVSKPLQGHLKDLATVRVMRDARTDQELKRGDTFTVKIFEPGEKVQVVGVSKGKGFQGVVKRHGFHGSPASHGHKDQLRMPGSIGATDPARVFKGTRMAGQMGNQQVTVKNLEVVEIHPEANEIFIKGALPGSRGTLLVISTKDGEIQIDQPEKKEEQKSEETTKTEEGVTNVSSSEASAEEKKSDDQKAEAVVEEKVEAKAEEKPAEEPKAEETKEDTK